MLGHHPGVHQNFPPHVFNEQTWLLAKYTSLSGSPKVTVEGNVRAVFSSHRRQLSVWNENRMLICIDLHYAKTTVPTKDCYAIVKESNVSLCRLKFRSLPDRVSFGAALADFVHVANDRGASQDVSSQGWQANHGTPTSSQAEFNSSQGKMESGSSQMVGGYNWNGNSPLNTFTPPYTPPSQPIIGTTNNSQSWKMTPPSSQSTSQQFKNLMQPHEISSHTIPELRMEKSGWNTPLKRPAENPRDTVVKKKKDEPTNSDHWETSSSFTATYSDSDSLNDSFSSCSSQKSEFSSQSTSQSIFPSKTDVSTECTVENNDMSTQTESPYSFDEEIQTLLKKLLDHPEFVSFTNLLSSQIDEDEELLGIVDRSFAIDGEEDGDKTQPLEEDEKEDGSGNESDHSDIIDL